MVLKLPSLEYTRASDDVTETFKIIHGYYDRETVPCSSWMNLPELANKVTLSNYARKRFLNLANPRALLFLFL